MWLGTWANGLSRFDGEAFHTYPVIEAAGDDPIYPMANSVHAIAEDSEGRVWLGTTPGVMATDGDELSLWTADDGLAGGDVRALHVDRAGHLWIGSGNAPWQPGHGVSRYDGCSFMTMTVADGLCDDTVLSIAEDSQGRVWFGTPAGACFWDGQCFAHLEPEGLQEPWILAIARDDGILWFGCRGESVDCGRLLRYDGRGLTSYTTEDGLGPGAVSGILPGPGGLWVATARGGASRFDGQTFERHTAREGLPDDMVGALAHDAEDDVWIGTGRAGVVGGGMSRHLGRRFERFTTTEGLPSNNAICLLETADGCIWMGAWGGVGIWDGARLTALPDFHEYVRCFHQDADGTIWIGTDPRGVYTCRAGCLAAFEPEALDGKAVYSILRASDGSVWFATLQAGLACWRHDRLSWLTTRDGLPDDFTTGLAEDVDGRIWVATRNGVCCVEDGEVRQVPESDGTLQPTGVHRIGESIWVSGLFGAECLADARSPNPPVVGGLEGVWVSHVSRDHEGDLWFGRYGGGVTRYDGLVFQRLHRRSGLPHDGVLQILHDRGGDVWMATDGGGVVRYRPRRVPPTVRLVHAPAPEHQRTAEITVPESDGVSFEFAGGSLTCGRTDLAYVYRLRGHRDTWTATRDTGAAFRDLAPGEYEFQVRAVDVDLNYSEPACVRIAVVPDPRVTALTEALSRGAGVGEWVGESQALGTVQDQLAEVARTDLTVLIRGETGTGKGLAARTLHALSDRSSGPLIHVNCGAIPDSLAESDLFGHERGSFTGAFSRRLGKVELAENGTLFLDEIGDMSPSAQMAILRLLEEGAFERVGGSQTLTSRARVVAATNRDLEAQARDGSFREDLYFRLQAFPVRLPPLRERREDVPLLVAYFAQEMAQHLGKELTAIEPLILERLQSHDWPGNVRELEHVVRRGVVLAGGPVLTLADIRIDPGAVGDAEATPLVSLDEHERRYIVSVLGHTGWVVRGPRGAASILGLPASTLRSRMKKLGIQRPGT